MTERTREWFHQWLTPPVLINLIGFVLVIGGAWVRLGALEIQVADLKTQIVGSQTAAQDYAKELVRLQEKIVALGDRLHIVETFKVDQEQINVRVFAGLSKVGG